ncbi:hypothetical protein [Phenylobacterium sp.]|uniref:hypothetical protein n=1 Tax=Phenylobacterium sp. TaxID=1871053 RepID=UPI0025DDF626|nr:hypothetical protein [Phenylobacterium sp.]
MRNLIRNEDLKTLFFGVSVAAASGLLMGAAFYPNLHADDVRGPQMLLSGGGPRSHVETADASWTSYAGRVPDYVVGTDSLRPPRYQVLAYDERAEHQTAETGDVADTGDVMAYEAPAQVQPAQWREEPREPARYPSQAGNVVYEADLPAPPPPPSDQDEAPL